MGSRRFDVLVVGAGPARQHRRTGPGPRRGPTSPWWTRRGSRGTRPAVTSSGRGASRCWPISRCPSLPGSTSATWWWWARPVGGSSSPASTGPLPRSGPAVTRTVLRRTPCATPPSMPAPSPSTGGPTAPSGRMPTLEGFTVDGGDELRADFVIGADGATSHVAQVAGLVEDATGAVGVRGAVLSGPAGRPPGDHAVGADAGGEPFPGTAGSSPAPGGRQRRGRHRDAGGPPGRRRSGAQCCRPISTTWSTSDSWTGRRPPAAPPPGRVAQDGHGGDHAGRRAGAAGR